MVITLKTIKRFIFGNYPMNIKRNYLVLEVGSGNNPYFRSDVLVDKYIKDSTERSSGNPIFIDRPFVVADAINLPFKDKSFDYIISKHIIEHLEEPEKFFKELMRVGKGGYIETPSELSEKLFGWRFHKWLVKKKNENIILTQKDKGIINPFFHSIFHKINKKDKYFYKFCENNLDLFFVMYEWKNKISYKILREKGKRKEKIEFKEAQFDTDYSYLNKKNKNMRLRFIYDLLKIFNFILNGKRKINLYSLLACPVCKSDLIHFKNKLECTKCNKNYPIINNIPILLG